MDPTKNDNHVKWYCATQVILSAAHMGGLFYQESALLSKSYILKYPLIWSQLLLGLVRIYFVESGWRDVDIPVTVFKKTQEIVDRSLLHMGSSSFAVPHVRCDGSSPSDRSFRCMCCSVSEHVPQGCPVFSLQTCSLTTKTWANHGKPAVR